MASAQGIGQCLFVHQPASGGVDQEGGRLHQLQLPGTDEIARLFGQRAMQGQCIDLWQQLVQVEAIRALRPSRQVADQHPHAQGFGQLRHGTAQLAMPEQAEGLAVQLDDREVEQAELSAFLPASAGDGSLVVGQPRCQG